MSEFAGKPEVTTLCYELDVDRSDLVFSTPERALYVSRLHDALGAKTWGEFKKRIPPEEWARIAKWLEPGVPKGRARFRSQDVPGFCDGDWPPWLKAEMGRVMPEEILRAFGTYAVTSLNGSYWVLPIVSLEGILKALRERGIRAVPFEAVKGVSDGHSDAVPTFPPDFEATAGSVTDLVVSDWLVTLGVSGRRRPEAARMALTINRGANYHGELDEAFYIQKLRAGRWKLWLTAEDQSDGIVKSSPVAEMTAPALGERDAAAHLLTAHLESSNEGVYWSGAKLEATIVKAGVVGLADWLHVAAHAMRVSSGQRLGDSGFLLWLERFVGDWDLEGRQEVVQRRADGLLSVLGRTAGIDAELGRVLTRGKLVARAKDIFGPRPIVLSQPLMEHWLTPSEANRLRGARNVGSGLRAMVQALEERIAHISESERDRLCVAWWKRMAGSGPPLKGPDRAVHERLYERYLAQK